MATQVMPEVKPVRQFNAKREPGERSVEQIIRSARSAPVQVPALGAWILGLATTALLWMSYFPLAWGPLAWIALVPLALLVRIPRRTRLMYTAILATAFLQMVLSLQWMRLGDVTMYPAWFALAFYTALYVPMFVALSRVAVHRFGVPLVVAVPAAWTGLEFIRSNLMTGFPWYLLGHTQYAWIEAIQISDLFGAYGVSFVVAMASACVAGLVPVEWLNRLRLLPAGDLSLPVTGHRRWLPVAVCLAVFGATLTYGFVRRAQAEFREGPRIALTQGNFPTSVKHDPRQGQLILNKHHELTGMAVPHQPDVIVWPETMYRTPLMISSPDLSNDDLMRVAPHIPPEVWRNASGVPKVLQGMSEQTGSAMIIGLDTFVADETSSSHFNSAALFVPDVLGVRARYDKMHRVPFGEYIPLHETFPWLRSFTPFSPQFGLKAGDRATVFKVKNWHLAPVICFEDTVPHLIRGIVHSLEQQGTNVDCLVNLTNDGWFHGSSELDQHLATAVFRSVECRTPMVRSVNTGISAVIDGDGVVVEPDVFIDADEQNRTSMRDASGTWHRQLNAVVIDSVPLDNRSSLYVRFGDWFAGLCCFGCVLAAFASFLPKRWLGTTPAA